MEFEQMVDALEFKLQPKVFVKYSSTLRAHLGLFGLVWACLGLFGIIWACLGLFQLMSHGRIVITTVRFSHNFHLLTVKLFATVFSYSLIHCRFFPKFQYLLDF